MQMNWVNSLKIAIIKRDILEIGELTKNIPEFDDIEEMRCVADLILEAKKIVEDERSKLLKALEDTKKARNFLLQEQNNKRFNAVF